MKKVKSLVVISVIVMLLTSCATTSKSQNYRWLNPNFDGNLSPEIPSLKDDFYQHVNYEWLKNTEIPDNSLTISNWRNCQISVNSHIKKMLETSGYSTNEEKQAEIYYNQIINQKSYSGLDYAKKIAEKYKNITSIEELWETTYSENCVGSMPINVYYLNADNLNTRLYSPSITPDFCIGDLNLYLSGNNEEINRTYELYKIYYAKMLKKLNWSENPETSIEKLFEFESNLAKKTLTNPSVGAYSTDIINTYFPNIPLTKILENKGVTNTKFVIKGMELLKEMNKEYNNDNLEIVKTIFICQFIKNYGMYIDEESKSDFFVLKQKLNKYDVAYPEEEIHSVLLSNLDEAVSIAWLNDYFSEEIRQQVTDLVQEIVDGFKNRLMIADWISDRTKLQAINKLNFMKYNIGYPATMNDYSGLSLENSSSLLESAILINKYIEQSNIKTAASYNNKDRWMFAPTTANAYYYTTDNSFNICAGILNDEFFNKDWPKEKKMGGIGLIIAHEITHAFDMNGGISDKDGNHIMWWDADNYMELVEKSKKLSAYIVSQADMEEIILNPEQWSSESVADSGAVAVMIDIASTIPNFDYDLFFRQFAICFREKGEKSVLKHVYSTDPHPLAYLRINATVQMYDKFYEIYDIQPGDKMYLPEDERIRVW